MKATTKKNKTKNLTIRMREEVYNFIDSKAKQQGITKADYFISQLDSNGELMNHLKDESSLMQLQIQQAKKEMKEMEEEMLNLLVSLDDSKLIELYKTENNTKSKKQIRMAAKKKGIALPA